MDILAPYHPWIALAATLMVFLGLQLRRSTPPDLLFLGGLVLVTLCGVISPETALAGFANPAVLTIAALLAVAAGLRSSGVLDWVGRRLLGNVHTERGALVRIAAAIGITSPFLLNTALVAMLAPLVVDWCRRRHISPSRLLMPVSYLTILFGVTTLIGTSTTLVANGIIRQEYDRQTAALEKITDEGEIAAQQKFISLVEPMTLFELGKVGLPCALFGAALLLLLGPKLLPNRTDMLEQLGEQRREYLVEMMVLPSCPLIGQSVEVAGLRHLPGLFLIEIDRNGDILTPVTPQDEIHANDRLIFTGVVSTIVDLEKIPGLVPAADMSYEFSPQKKQHRHLTEVVLSKTSPLIGYTVRGANFRQRYNAAVIAVHRNGVRLTNKIGNIEFEPGDTLLLQTRNEFVATYRNSRDFYLVSGVEGVQPVRHDKAKLAALLVGVLVLWLSIASIPAVANFARGFASPPIAAIAVVGLMIAARCLRVSDARNAIDLQVLVTIAAALGLGQALTQSGAASQIAEGLVAGLDHPYLLLIVVYLLTMFFTEMISNTAVAAMFLPLAIAVAAAGGYNPRPFIMAVTLAASLSFLTPIGYQTNLMVMGPGGYRPLDYLKCGIPLAATVTVVALFLLPIIWPF